MNFKKTLYSNVKKVLGKGFVKKIRPIWHGGKSILYAIRYGLPAKKMTIIGITGTKGKTTTAAITGRLFNLSGIKTGYISTAVINLGEEEFLNPYKMSTIDSGIMQKYLAKMLKNSCEVVVVEMTSQGLEQNRHLGLFGFDAGVFLNIFPEHIEAHGGFDNYKKAKSRMFKNIKQEGVFFAHREAKELSFMTNSLKNNVEKIIIEDGVDYDIIDNENGINYGVLYGAEVLEKTCFSSRFDIQNLAMAIKIVTTVGHKTDLEVVQLAGQLDNPVPGRMEFVVKQDKFDILVDYAHEPESMEQLLTTLDHWKHKGLYQNLIHVVSCDGVGRDDWKKPILGDLSYKIADYTVVTTDNYEREDNPFDIVGALSKNFDKSTENNKYFINIDRKKAFQKAIELANSISGKSVIVSTGVGSEAGLTQPNGKMEWEEGRVWQDLALDKKENIIYFEA